MHQVTIEQAMQLALQHHRAGRANEAGGIYRQILEARPDHPEALHLLGILAGQAGRPDVAANLLRRAVQIRPDYSEAYCNLGLFLTRLNEFDAAIAACREAIRLKPDFADAHVNLADALHGQGHFADAAAACRRAIELRPDFPEAYCNLANALCSQVKFEEAAAACRSAIELRPDYAEAFNNLGVALYDQGKFDEATAAYRQAVRLKAVFPGAWTNWGNALCKIGKFEEAVEACRQAVRQAPVRAQAHSNLANALCEAGRPEEALGACTRAIELKPDFAEAYYNLAQALMYLRKLDDAVAAFRRAIDLKPLFSEAFDFLGTVLKEQGNLDAAISSYRQAVELKPQSAPYHSNLLYARQFHPGDDAAAIDAECRRWNERHAVLLTPLIEPHVNDPNPDRELRVGYVSPDFRDHVIGRNLLPLLREHTVGQVAAFCYSAVLLPDRITDYFRSYARGWRNIAGLSDDQLARQIREDRIDILVDLTLHLAHNRLPLFAQKPAPVQVTFAGYPGTTGLDAIDYRLTDIYLDPPGQQDSSYSEQSVRLPDSFWCYDPTAMTTGMVAELQVQPAPVLSTGRITFGCLNNFCKVNDRVLTLWSNVLKAAGNSRLVMMAPEGIARKRVHEAFSREGVDPLRIEFVSMASREEYLQRYGRIDIGLDTFPYNGHTTSLDALWMGVPVVTLVGKTVVGRAGLSQLTNLGLTELVATSEDQYVQIARDLAGDLPRLGELRSTLRERMRQSPLTDAPRFARNIESAYRQMWRRWCEGRQQQVKGD